MHVVAWDGSDIMSDSVKDEVLGGSVKDKNDKPRRKHWCPYCGNEMRVRINNGFVFCDKCHRRMPWMIVKTDEEPIKPL